jgi:hypothetical protein
VFRRESDKTSLREISNRFGCQKELLTPSVAAGTSVVVVCSVGTVLVNSVVTGKVVVGSGCTRSETGRAKLAGRGTPRTRAIWHILSMSLHLLHIIVTIEISHRTQTRVYR